MKFVVGLGNPGRKYARTRHNLGFRVLELLRRRWSAGPERSAFDGLLCEARPERGGAAARVLLLAPQTYMNNSGRAVRRIVSFYRADVSDVLVVLDDMELAVGRLRVRAGGSAGGHKGLSDVLEALGTGDVPRLRIGIGRPPASWDPVDYVLAPFAKDEIETIEAAVELAGDAVEDWVFLGASSVMEKYNRAPEGCGPSGR